MKRIATTLAALVLLTVGCETHVVISETRIEDIATQSRVLAIAARNLDDAMRTRTATPEEQEAARAAAQFHNDTETFARVSSRQASMTNINDTYEMLINSWLKLKEAFPKVKSDSLLAETYRRVVHEWDRVARATGYSGTAYEKSRQKKK